MDHSKLVPGVFFSISMPWYTWVFLYLYPPCYYSILITNWDYICILLYPYKSIITKINTL